jgi:hypothetical protein
MTPVEIIATVAVCLTVGGAIAYIIKSKRSGAKCIGCPYARECGAKGNSHCKCQSRENDE